MGLRRVCDGEVVNV